MHLVYTVGLILLLGSCTSDEKGNEANSSSGSTAHAPSTVEGLVVNAVAPYDYESAIDETIIHHALDERVESFVADCVTARGGISSYEPTPPPTRESITDEVLIDFPNFDLLDERGRTLIIEPPDPSIRREDYSTEEEYIEATHLATLDRVFTDDERGMREDCMSEPGYASVGEPLILYQGVRGDWTNQLREIDVSDEVDDLRDEFRECVVAEGMNPAAELNEVTFWAYVDGELTALVDDEQLLAHNRERGMLFARCGRSIYDVKAALRKDAQDAFVEEHADDIAALSDYLYGEGILEVAEGD